MIVTTVQSIDYNANSIICSTGNSGLSVGTTSIFLSIDSSSSSSSSWSKLALNVEVYEQPLSSSMSVSPSKTVVNVPTDVVITTSSMTSFSPYVTWTCKSSF